MIKRREDDEEVVVVRVIEGGDEKGAIKEVIKG